MLSAEYLREQFETARDYERYVMSGNADQRRHWAAFAERAHLSDTQQRLVRGFVREMNVLTISGVWCGDCVQQCPFLAHIADANPDRIHLRFVDRDQHAELSGRLRMCAGGRVPVVIFMAEDFEFCGLAGDRTLARYRALAARQLGPSCPLPGAPLPPDEIAATRQEWLDEFERVQLMLRLSTRLRQKHGD